MSGTSTPSKGTDKKDDVKLEWTENTENLLVSWADIATCYKWMHDQSFRMFQRANYAFSIPIIIMSTITGTLSVGMNSIVPEEWVHTAQIAVGGINIFTGIISTLQNFFHYAQLSEAHFNAGVGWSKLHRNIAVELSVDRKYRKNADTFIRVCRADYDRLLEQSPTIPQKVISLFKETFKKNKDLIRPDICDHLQHLSAYVERATVDFSVETDDIKSLSSPTAFSPQAFCKEPSPKLSESKPHASPKCPPPVFIPPPYRRASIRRRSDGGLHHLMSDAPHPINISREAPSVKDLIRRFTIDLPPPVSQKPKTPPTPIAPVDVPLDVELTEVKIETASTPKADTTDNPVLRPKLNRKHKNLQKFDFKLDIKTDDEADL